MGVILDTNIIISAQNERDKLSKLIAKLSSYQDAFIAAITVSELLVGVQCAKTKQIGIMRSAFAENIIRVIPTLDFNVAVARVYAKLYSEALAVTKALREKRSNLNVRDLQIAATALSHNFALATSNVDDFKRISGLTIVDH